MSSAPIEPTAVYLPHEVSPPGAAGRRSPELPGQFARGHAPGGEAEGTLSRRVAAEVSRPLLR